MPRRRRASRRQKRDRNRAYLNIGMIVVAIAIVGWSLYAIRPAPFDNETLCVLSDELPPHTAVIIDKTDEYTGSQANRIANVIRRTGERLEVGEKLTIFELNAAGQFDPRGEFSLCNPGRGRQVNPLFRNPELIEERYTAKFEEPLNAVLEDLVEPKEAPASPILEALTRLARTEAFSEDAPRRKVVLISDMLQNSEIFTAYGGGGELPASSGDPRETADTVMDRFGDGLRGVQIEVRLIPRDRHVDLQRGPLRDYWDALLDDLGASADWRDL